MHARSDLSAAYHSSSSSLLVASTSKACLASLNCHTWLSAGSISECAKPCLSAVAQGRWTITCQLLLAAQHKIIMAVYQPLQLCIYTAIL